mmetsp:Transcript_19692/g.54069  ORF Transcript_19692/g.54069 Transcript_19692/m.54069 type:complete len:335 (+) Transcript_19692:83-1087(+)
MSPKERRSCAAPSHHIEALVREQKGTSGNIWPVEGVVAALCGPHLLAEHSNDRHIGVLSAPIWTRSIQVALLKLVVRGVDGRRGPGVPTFGNNGIPYHLLQRRQLEVLQQLRQVVVHLAHRPTDQPVLRVPQQTREGELVVVVQQHRHTFAKQCPEQTTRPSALSPWDETKPRVDASMDRLRIWNVLPDVHVWILRCPLQQTLPWAFSIALRGMQGTVPADEVCSELAQLHGYSQVVVLLDFPHRNPPWQHNVLCEVEILLSLPCVRIPIFRLRHQENGITNVASPAAKWAVHGKACAPYEDVVPAVRSTEVPQLGHEAFEKRIAPLLVERFHV